MAATWTVVLLLPLCLAEGAPTSLEGLVAAKESALLTLVATHERVHSGRCTATCQCSVSACGSVFSAADGFACEQEGSTCPSCTGSFRSSDTTALRFSPGSDLANPELRDDICATHSTLSTFQDNRDAYDVDAYQYLSHKTGTLRMFPAIPQDRENGKCSKYDPRIRPWYVTAASGPKDVILVLDVSGSMTSVHDVLLRTSRLDAVKGAVAAVLDTLTHNDYVSIVTFSDSATVLGTRAMVRATAEAIEYLKKKVNSVTAGGGTHFMKGLTAAFQTFEAAVANEATSHCSRTILFLSDGEASDASSVSPSLEVLQSSLAAKLGSGVTTPVSIFTYSMGADADHVLPKDIACKNKGVWALIPNSVDPLTHMSHYYQYLAAGIKSTKPRWTTPYEDAFGLGTLVTVAGAVYDRSGDVPLLIGVAGIDVKISALEKFDGYETVVANLILRSSECTSASLTECDLQRLRASAGAECPAPAPPLSTCAAQEVVNCASTKTSSELLCEEMSSTTKLPVNAAAAALSYKDVNCCGTCSFDPSNPSPPVTSPEEEEGAGGADAGLIVGVVMGSIGGVCFIVFCYCCLVSDKKDDKTAANEPAHNDVEAAKKPSSVGPHAPSAPPARHVL